MTEQSVIIREGPVTPKNQHIPHSMCSVHISADGNYRRLNSNNNNGTLGDKKFPKKNIRELKEIRKLNSRNDVQHHAAKSPEVNLKMNVNGRHSPPSFICSHKFLSCQCCNNTNKSTISAQKLRRKDDQIANNDGTNNLRGLARHQSDSVSELSSCRFVSDGDESIEGVINICHVKNHNCIKPSTVKENSDTYAISQFKINESDRYSTKSSSSVDYNYANQTIVNLSDKNNNNNNININNIIKRHQSTDSRAKNCRATDTATFIHRDLSPTICCCSVYKTPNYQNVHPTQFIQVPAYFSKVTKISVNNINSKNNKSCSNSEIKEFKDDESITTSISYNDEDNFDLNKLCRCTLIHNTSRTIQRQYYPIIPPEVPPKPYSTADENFWYQNFHKNSQKFEIENDLHTQKLSRELSCPPDRDNRSESSQFAHPDLVICDNSKKPPSFIKQPLINSKSNNNSSFIQKDNNVSLIENDNHGNCEPNNNTESYISPPIVLSIAQNPLICTTCITSAKHQTLRYDNHGRLKSSTFITQLPVCTNQKSSALKSCRVNHKCSRCEDLDKLVYTAERKCNSSQAIDINAQLTEEIKEDWEYSENYTIETSSQSSDATYPQFEENNNDIAKSEPTQSVKAVNKIIAPPVVCSSQTSLNSSNLVSTSKTSVVFPSYESESSPLILQCGLKINSFKYSPASVQLGIPSHKRFYKVPPDDSGQTTAFHYIKDYTSFKPSPLNLKNTISNSLRRPLVTNPILDVQSSNCGQITKLSAIGANVKNSQWKKAMIMEKRRNTLDRFQRLGFGRKSSPRGNVNASSSSHTSERDVTTLPPPASRICKLSEKSEKLKELTGLLKIGNRSSMTQPPALPPRRLRAQKFTNNSFDKSDTPTISEQGDPIKSETTAKTLMDAAIEVLPMMDQEDDESEKNLIASETTFNPCENYRNIVKKTESNTQQINMNRSKMYTYAAKAEKCMPSPVIIPPPPPPPPSPPPTFIIKPPISAKTLHTKPSVFSTTPTFKLNKAEARTVIGSYAQKGIPFRSASFSQIDYNSGKYRKSSLSVLRDHLRREKAVECTSPTTSIIDSVIENFTWPPKKVNDKEGKLASIKEPEPYVVSESKQIKNNRNFSPPLKKSSSKLSINLCYYPNNSSENAVGSPNIITDDEVFTADATLEVPEKPAAIITATMVASHAKMESLTDTISPDNDFAHNVNIQTSEILQENLLSRTSNDHSNQILQEGNNLTIELGVQNVAMLMEEYFPLESPPENLLQTATTCLIPLPVFECAGEEWNFENPPPEWIEVKSEEFGVLPKTIEPILVVDECKNLQKLTAKSKQDRLLESVPTIAVNCLAVSTSKEETRDELRKSGVNSSKDFLDCNKVNKFYSHDDVDIPIEEQFLLDNITTRHSSDERRKVDMSKRRKGIYIEHWQEPAHSENGDIRISSNTLTLDTNVPKFPDVKGSATPPTLRSIELNTASSERMNAPDCSLPSLKCQCPEEQDDFALAVTKSCHISRNDSLSDTESDRTSPTSRGRNSPAFGDYNGKRYSKRPLRGPYGQMLEAEMKKPSNKKHFEEILNDLKENERLQQKQQQCQEMCEKNIDGKIYYMSSMRNEANAHLPVPVHVRAMSTPTHAENNDYVHTNNDIISTYWTHNDYNATFQGKKNVTSSVSSSAYNPMPLENNLGDKNKKRAYSETAILKSNQHKRSQSMNCGDKAHHFHQPKRSLNISIDNSENANKTVNHTSSPPTNTTATYTSSGINILPTPELLAALLKGSSEKLLSEQRYQMSADTRTHIVEEIFRNEQSYVDSLQTVVSKYFKVLKMPEHAGMIDPRTVDEIFFMVPDILKIHDKFLFDLRNRLDNWDNMQKVGDAFMETFSRLEVLEVYTSFVNNCSRAKNAIRTTKHQRPSFAKFLEATAREHKGKLTLDNLLIKPVQKFPNYEMLFQRLIKHTDHDHPDQKHLQDVLKLVHDILVHINCKEKEILENGQREATLKELESVIEGITELTAPDRQFLLFDLVTMPSGQGARKERGFFLFNDLLVVTSIKKRSGTIKKPSVSACPGIVSTLDTNKYKFLTKVSLDNLEIVKIKDENLKRTMTEIENLAEDCNKLQQIADITASLRYPHQYLEDVVRELHRDVQRQLSEKQTNDAQLNMLELAVTSVNGTQRLNIVFSKADKRTQWEETFNEAKQKLVATLERHPIPQFLTSIPIRKTRAGLQFTCAAATLNEKHDVWVCNSDGYVGQVCIMSLYPEPNVTSCNGVCNARILCVASVPAYSKVACGTPTLDNISSKEYQIQQKKQNCTSLPPNSYTQQLLDYRKSISPNYSPSSTLCAQDKRPVQNVANINDNTGVGQLDLNLSSSDEELETSATFTVANHNMQKQNSNLAGSYSADCSESSGPSTHTLGSTSNTSTAIVGSSGTLFHGHEDSNVDDSDSNQPTMWIGTEDGCIHIYNSTDNIRIKKNRIKIEHHSAVYSILYLENRVFVSLANGEIYVYFRDGGSWNTISSHCVTVGTVADPVTKLLNVNGKLWCSVQGVIKVLNVETLMIMNEIQISSKSKPITNMTVSNNHVWISIQNSAHIKCFHSTTHQLITEVNLTPTVNKMLSNCDEIIRQHKAACLRVTSLLSCHDLIWIGTSAGVLLTLPAKGCDKQNANIVPSGIPHGHTGHVRFLTYVEPTINATCSNFNNSINVCTINNRENLPLTSSDSSISGTKSPKIKSETKISNTLIISGGDGYEDFRNSGANSLSEIAGREDSTNHLLIWQI